MVIFEYHQKCVIQTSSKLQRSTHSIGKKICLVDQGRRLHHTGIVLRPDLIDCCFSLRCAQSAHGLLDSRTSQSGVMTCLRHPETPDVRLGSFGFLAANVRVADNPNLCEAKRAKHLSLWMADNRERKHRNIQKQYIYIYIQPVEGNAKQG